MTWSQALRRRRASAYGAGAGLDAVIDTCRRLVEECGQDADRFAAEWTAKVRAWSFERVNVLVRQHNAWYPLEVDLPMDPRSRDFVPIHGKSYRRLELGPAWAAEHFPADPRARGRSPKLPAQAPREPL